MDIIKRLKSLKTFLNITSNGIVLLQIILIFMMIFLSIYAFLELLNMKAFVFVKPLADLAKSFMAHIFKDTIQSSSPEIDGALLAFLILTAIIIFILVQTRTGIKCYIEELDKKIVEEKIRAENEFNKALDYELQKDIRTYSNWMLGIMFHASPLIADSMQIYGEAKLDTQKVEAACRTVFVNGIKNLPGIKLTEENNIILLTSAKFESIDKIMDTIQDIIKHLKQECKTKKIILKPRFAVETFKPRTQSNVVLDTVTSLLNLNLGGTPLCYGNFKNRHSLMKTSVYTVEVKGRYLINGEEQTVYTLVRKI